MILLTIHLAFNRLLISNTKLLLITLPLSLVLLVSCTSIPKDALSLSPESLQQRQMQTRRFETTDEAKILAACAGLLQDMGFNLDESETELGVIVGSKERSAVNAAQVAGAIVIALLGGGHIPTDKVQKMRVCIVSRPIGEKKESIAVRVTFQRIVWNDQGQVTKREGIVDPKVYQEFFEKLSKSIFLEANEI